MKWDWTVVRYVASAVLAVAGSVLMVKGHTSEAGVCFALMVPGTLPTKTSATGPANDNGVK